MEIMIHISSARYRIIFCGLGDCYKPELNFATVVIEHLVYSTRRQMKVRTFNELMILLGLIAWCLAAIV